MDSVLTKEMAVIQKYGFKQSKDLLAGIRKDMIIPEPYSNDPILQEFRRALLDSGELKRDEGGDGKPRRQTLIPSSAPRGGLAGSNPAVPNTELMQQVMEVLEKFPYTKDNDIALVQHVQELYVNHKSIERARRKVQEMAREKVLDGLFEYKKYLSSETMARLRKTLAEKYKDWSGDFTHNPTEKGGNLEGEEL